MALHRPPSPKTRTLAALAGILALIGLPAKAGPASAPAVAHQVMTIAAADGRQVAVTVYAPAAGCRKCTLVIFSHGARSTPGRYDVLLDAWAASGLVVAAPLHTDSEEHPDRGRYADTLATRLADWRAVDAAMRGAPVAGVTLSGKVVAAGHSYGALIAQIAGGARTLRATGTPHDWRVPSP